MNIEEILKMPGFFRCERLHAVMRESLCVKYQSGEVDNHPMHAFVEKKECCVKCKQGEVIKQRLDVGGQSNLPLPPPKGDKLNNHETKGEGIMEEAKTKECRKCGKVGTLDEFGINKHKKDGHESICIGCKRAYAEAWRRKKGIKAIPVKKKEIRSDRTALGNPVPIMLTPAPNEGRVTICVDTMEPKDRKILLETLAGSITAITFKRAA